MATQQGSKQLQLGWCRGLLLVVLVAQLVITSHLWPSRIAGARCRVSAGRLFWRAALPAPQSALAPSRETVARSTSSTCSLCSAARLCGRHHDIFVTILGRNSCGGLHTCNGEQGLIPPVDDPCLGGEELQIVFSET